MCITFQVAALSNTKLYAGEARRGDTYVHVIAYQNKATTRGPNAMILPLPAAVMPGPENVVDTRGFKRFLDDIHYATQIREPRRRGSSGGSILSMGNRPASTPTCTSTITSRSVRR